jgi:hypothetical protein
MNNRTLNKAIWDKASSYIFLVLWLPGFFVLTLYPMGCSLYRSFTNFNITFRYVFISVPLKLAFALAAAILMNQKLKRIPFYRAIYYISTLPVGSAPPADVAAGYAENNAGTSALIADKAAFGQISAAQGGRQIYDILVRLINK